MKLWLDTEFNDYKGELLSLALVDEDCREWYGVSHWQKELTRWVSENVAPVFNAEPVPRCVLQSSLEVFLSEYDSIHVIADWPEDIQHFCALLISGPGERINTPPLTMEVRRDLNTDTSLVPHNALADARALRIMDISGGMTCRT